MTERDDLLKSHHIDKLIAARAKQKGINEAELVETYYNGLLLLLDGPNAAHDDQVDATTLALNQLCGTLYLQSKKCVIPARLNEMSTIVVYDLTDNVVVNFERTPAEPVTNQITQVYSISSKFDNAVVRAFGGFDEALLKTLEHRGVYVERVTITQQELAQRTRTGHADTQPRHLVSLRPRAHRRTRRL